MPIPVEDPVGRGALEAIISRRFDWAMASRAPETGGLWTRIKRLRSNWNFVEEVEVGGPKSSRKAVNSRLNHGLTIETEPQSAHESVTRTAVPPATSTVRGIDAWLTGRLDLFAPAVVVAALLVRIFVAGRSFLNPDEALHYIILNQRSAYWAYRISLTNAHPPLIYLLLYYWKFLGRSELMLRFPSVIAGTAACWFAYKWTGRVFGRAAGAIALILFAFSPATIALSAQVRSYALLLFFETAALYFAEVALSEGSVRKMWSFSALLCLAILSHYSAIFFAIAIGAYVVARLVEGRSPRGVVIAWLGGQAGLLALCGFLYVTHVSKLRSYIGTPEVAIENSYPGGGHEHLFTYARERTLGIFIYLFENHYVAQGLLLFWILAIAILLLGHSMTRNRRIRFPATGVLMLVPVLAVFGAGVAGHYPYVGSRHTVFLAPMLFAALSFFLAKVTRQKLWAAGVIAILLVVTSNASGPLFEPYITKENQRLALMKAAVSDMQRDVPAGSLIMTDYQSALLLVYYLCGPDLILPVGAFNLPASRLKCNGYTIASFQTWSMQAPFLLQHFEELANAQRMALGERVWIFQSGWGPTLAADLPRASRQFRCVTPRTYGDNISIIPLAVGADFTPVATVSNCP